MTTLYGFLWRIKYFAVVFAVAMCVWFLTYRWTRIFRPAWLWIAGAVVVTVIGILIYELMKRRHEKKMAAGLESGIAEAEGDKIDLKGEIKALRENWSSSVDSLKSADAGSGRQALYRLPWFMIIGEPASGKSTLLRKSGLDFPIGDAAVRGMHGTRNCDWWFANEAIFLDTAGRYIIETQEQEWIAFLSLIGKYRRKKPISGVLVAVAANSLLTKSHEELLQDGKRIRNRVDELIEVLGVNFPIFVLITKVDLVSGFREFFGPLDERYREQMLGFTLPVERNVKFEMDTYDRKFAEVTERLYRMRPWLESKVGPRELGKAFLFPEEFSYLGDPLRTVLDVVFKPNVYQETPVCRGVYFSSGTQVGSPLAKALEDMAKDLHIPAEFGMGIGLDEEKEIRTYFIKDLVSRQILSDRNLTWRTGRSEIRAKKRRMGWGMVGIGLAAILGLFTTASYFTNRTRLTDFQEHLPKADKPLPMALGTLAAKDEATPAGFGDMGLNYSDEVIPTLEDSFRQVTLKGCVYPPMGDLRKAFDAGIPETEEGAPDVSKYMLTWGHYQYLKRGLAGELPEDYDPASEESHLDDLMSSLRTRGIAADENTKEELRTVIRRFGADDGVDALPEKDRDELRRRMEEIEGSFYGSLGGWMNRVETFVTERRGEGEQLRRNFDKGIELFMEACATERVLPHENLEQLEAIADTIRSAASGLEDDAGGQTPISSLAASESDLVTTLESVRDGTPEDSGLPPRAKSMLEPFSGKEISSTLPPKHQALLRLVAELDAVMEPGRKSPEWPATPTDRDLAGRRRDISEEIEELGKDVWERIEPHVKAIHPGQVYEEVGEGEDKKTVRKPGWYDTIPLLAKARRADQRLQNYLDNGLDPWLGDVDDENQKWRKDGRNDSKSEIFSTKQIVEVILPRLRAEAEFFELASEEPLVARDIAEGAREEIHTAMADWVRDADAHWWSQFESALPSPSRTLQQVRTQLDELRGTRPSLLVTNCKNVQQALGDVNRIADDPEEDAILADSLPARKALWEKWAVCFRVEDPNVYTYHRAVGDLADFSDAIGLVVGPLGTNSEQARKLVAAVMEGGGSFLATASTIPEKVLAGSPDGTPRAEFAKRFDALVRTAWAGLLDQAAEDVNDEWSRVRIRLSSVDTMSEFQNAFGPTGPFGTFRQEYLEELFDGPNLVSRRELFGSRLVATEDFRKLMRQKDALTTNLLDGSGNYRRNRVVMDLQLGGTAANGLVVEYQPKTGGTESSPRYINGPRETFEVEWSPGTCQEFRFTVYFPNAESEVHRWTGDWALAAAFREARREGDRYIWPKTPGAWKNDAGEAYEVILELLPGTVRGLIEFYPGGNVGDPVKSLTGSLPDKAVRVEGGD